MFTPLTPSRTHVPNGFQICPSPPLPSGWVQRTEMSGTIVGSCIVHEFFINDWLTHLRLEVHCRYSENRKRRWFYGDR